LRASLPAKDAGQARSPDKSQAAGERAAALVSPLEKQLLKIGWNSAFNFAPTDLNP